MKNNNQRQIHQLYLNGPRFLTIVIFTFALIGKILNPTTFFTLTYSLDIPKFFPELFFSFLLTAEFFMVVLLVVSPRKGILGSSLLLFIVTIMVAWLHINGFNEPCGFFGDLIMDEIGPAKILQNTGLILLLISSLYLRKNIDTQISN